MQHINKTLMNAFRVTPGHGKYRYAIAPQERFLINLLGILSLASLAFLAIGFFNFIRLSTLAEMVFPLPFIVIFLFRFINALLMTFYPGFDVAQHKKHVADYWKNHEEVRVGILIPVAGESLSVVAKTVKAALRTDYANKLVVLCDDTSEGKYQALAKRLGCSYVQHDKPGVRKKAGNVNYALSQYPGIEQVLILDADFVPRTEILRELVAYAGGTTGIVQSPQHFRLDDRVYGRSKTEFGAALIQRDFYRITQVARNRFDSAICVGTNALYSRKALDQVGGFEGVGGDDPWTHSEDVNTGLKMMNLRLGDGRSYHIRYIPVQLATGDCPDNYYSFYKQQSRWATGSTRLMFSRKTLFSKVLNPLQKLCYFSNALYYFYTVAILSMPVYFLTLVLAREHYSWHYTLFFIPQLLMTYLICPFVMRQEPEPIVSVITVMTTAYTFVQAIFLAIIRRPIGWEPTGHTKGTGRTFRQYKQFVLLYALGVYGVTLAVALRRHAFTASASIILQTMFLLGCFAQLAHMFYLFSDVWLVRKLVAIKDVLMVER